MALSFGENLGVLGNIKLTDVKLVAGAFRTIASGSDTGSITVQRVEDGQIIYIQSEDRLIKATKSGASVNWSDFSFPSSGSTGNFETITVGGGTFTSASLASSGVSSFGALADVPSGIVSASVLSSPSQGTIRLATNGNNTDVDSGLQSGDTPTFAGLVIQGNVSARGDIIAENYILKSSVTEVTTSFSSGSTIFGDTFNDTHQFTGSLFSSGSVTAPSFSGIFIGALSSSAQISTDISGSFTSVSSSLDTRLTNATASIAGLKADSGSFDTRLTNATASIQGLKTDSGSFSLRNTVLEATSSALINNFSQVQSLGKTDSVEFSTLNITHVTASGNVSGSSTSTGSFGRIEVGANTLSIGGTEIGKVVADNLTDLDQTVNTTSSPTFAGITLTGNIQTSGDIVAQRYIVSSSVSHITSSFSSGSTIFGDTLDDSHKFTGSLNVTGSVSAIEFSGIFNGALSSSTQIASDISGSFTAASSSFDTRITNATSSILGLKTDSGSFSTRITNATSSIAGLKVDSGSFDTRITNATSSIAGLKTDSGSFSTRATTLETTMVSEQANIDTLQSRVGQSLNTSDSPTFSSMTLTGDLIAQNYIVSSSVTHMTQSFSSGSTIFGDTLNDTHLFTGSLNVTGSITASGFTGDGSGLTNVFENTAASQSISSRLTNSTSSIAGLKVDSGSFSTRVTTLENTPGGIFQPTGSVRSTTNNLQVTGSFTATNTGSFGVLKQNNQIVASPTIFNVNQTNALEVDGNGDVQFINSNFSESKFLVDADFELDENGDFQQKIKLGDYFGTS